MTQARFIGYTGQYLDVFESDQDVAGNNTFSGTNSFNNVTVTGTCSVQSPTLSAHAVPLGFANSTYVPKSPALNLFSSLPAAWSILRVKTGGQEFSAATDYGMSLLALADVAANRTLLNAAIKDELNIFTKQNDFATLRITNTVAADGKIGQNLSAGDGLTVRGIKPNVDTNRRVTIDGDLFVNGTVNILSGGSPLKIWNETNDGPNSGLNADVLDGYHAQHFIDLVNNIDLTPYYNKNLDTVTTGSLDIKKYLAIQHTTPALKLESTNSGAYGVHLTNNGTLFKIQKMATSSELFINADSMMKLDLNTGNVRFAGDITAFSDERLKFGINKITDGLDVVLKLNPVKYKWKESMKDDLGLIAQEVEKILPDLVDSSETYKSVAYIKLIPYLIAAIKDIHDTIKKTT